MAKTTMQDIADALSVSRVTVWKALSDREGVAEPLRQKILDTAREMGYLKIPKPAEARNAFADYRGNIAAVVSRPESSVFWTQIIHHIAKNLAEEDLNLLYTYVPSEYRPGYTLPANLTDGTVDGMIILNVYNDEILSHLNDLPLPKVLLDTTPRLRSNQIKGDLVMIEGRDQIRLITGRLLDKGLTRVGFIGDIHDAQTNLDRFHGYEDAHTFRGLTPDPALVLTGPIGLHTHYAEISRFLSSLWDGGPTLNADGFVCASDFIAQFVQQFCEQHGIDREKTLALTGFDNSTEYSGVAGRITSVNVQCDLLGERLADKIRFRIRHPEVSPEVCYVLPDVIFRGKLAEG